MSALAFRSDIQGLRGIAVLAVMFFHFNPAWLPGGFIGVDLFLVISGYLVTSILLQNKEQADYSFKDALKYFYISRLKRIAPAYFVMLVVVALVAAVFFLPQDFNTFKKGLEKAVWFNSNNYFADFGDYFAPANHEQLLLHTWSLAVEIQFYLLAPFMVLLLPVRWLKWVFAILLVGLTALSEYRLRLLGIEQATYYSLYARLPEFFVGGLAALYATTGSGAGGKNPEWLSSIGLLLITLSATAQPLMGPFPGIAALLPVLCTALLLSQPAQGWVGKLLRCKILVWIGALSYSLYLWHWPVLAFLRYYTGVEVLGVGSSFLFVLLTLLLSICSYYAIERGFRSKYTDKKQAFGWVFLAAGVFGTSQVMAKVNAAFTPEEMQVEYRRYADPDSICHGKIVHDCLKGALNSEREVLVLGDSHAAMLNHFFDYLGQDLNFKARIVSASSCVTIPGFDYQRVSERGWQKCVGSINVGTKYINKINDIFIAGKWSSHTKSTAFNEALENFIINNLSKNIYILSQVPIFQNDVNRMRRFSHLGFSDKVTKSASYFIANVQLRGLASKHNNVSFLSLHELPVFKDAPYFDGLIIYMDKHHLNEKGSLAYAKAARDSFSTILGDGGSISFKKRVYKSVFDTKNIRNDGD